MIVDTGAELDSEVSFCRFDRQNIKQHGVTAMRVHREHIIKPRRMSKSDGPGARGEVESERRHFVGFRMERSKFCVALSEFFPPHLSPSLNKPLNR